MLKGGAQLLRLVLAGKPLLQAGSAGRRGGRERWQRTNCGNGGASNSSGTSTRSIGSHPRQLGSHGGQAGSVKAGAGMLLGGCPAVQGREGGYGIANFGLEARLWRLTDVRPLHCAR